MSRNNVTFRERDMRSAIKSAVAAGITIGRVEVSKDGRIAIIPKGAEPVAPVNDRANPWDEVLPSEISNAAENHS